MYQQHSSPYTNQRASPQHLKREHNEAENENGDHSSTPVKRERTSMNCAHHTPPTKLHAHPPGWERITWAPKVCRKPVRRMDFGEIATAAH